MTTSKVCLNNEKIGLLRTAGDEKKKRFMRGGWWGGDTFSAFPLFV